MPSIFLVLATKDGGYKKVQFEFEPDDLVSDKLDEWLRLSRGSDGALTHHADLEPVLYVGKDVPSGENKTFDQCGVENNDTIHALLRFRELHICIRGPEDQKFNVITLSRVKVSELKPIIASKFANTENVPIQNHLTLKTLDGKTLEDDAFVGEYIAERHSTLLLSFETRLKVKVYVPTFTSAESVIAQPTQSLKEVKEAVEKFYRPLVTTNRILIRGAVQTVGNRSHWYMCLDLFSSEQGHIYVEDTDDVLDFKFHFAIDLDKTIKDIYEVIEATKNSGLEDERIWPKQCHATLMKIFIPQMIAGQTKPLQDHEPVSLFFFPLEVVTVTEYFEPEQTINEVKAFVREKIDGNKGDRILCTSDNLRLLRGESKVHQHRDLFSQEDNALILKKPERREPAMRIKVQWTDSEDDLIQIGVEPSYSISTVKDIIEDDIGVPFFMQKLMFRDRLLEDDDTLETVGISNDSKLRLSSQCPPE